MIACSMAPPLLQRGVRRALDAMRTNVGHDWSLADLADISTLQRQFRGFLGKTPPRCSSRYRVRVRAARTAAWLTGFESHGRCRGLWLNAFRTIFSRVPAPLGRDTIAYPEAVSHFHRRSRIAIFIAVIE